MPDSFDGFCSLWPGVGMGISEYRIQKNLNPKLSGIIFAV